jgi:prepilin-type N-terminal cleavage/methylation domain-containing protein
MSRQARHSGLVARRRRERGFTLIELLTVVAIISLLVSMVVPTIGAILEMLTNARTLARIKNLSAGVTTYTVSGTGNRFFPGQQYPEFIEGGNDKYNSTRAASAFLARCLFSKPDPNDPDEDLFPVDNYAPYDDELLDPPETAGGKEGRDTPVAWSILDAHSQPMAIVYYPASKNMEGTLSQFEPEHNLRYTEGNTSLGEGGSGSGNDDTTIQDYVDGGDYEGQRLVHRDGEFVLHAAHGKSRLYFEGTLRNWE